MMSALGFEILFGSLTITGSLMAFGKLQELITGTPITYRFQNVSNIAHVLRHGGDVHLLDLRPAGGRGCST